MCSTVRVILAGILLFIAQMAHAQSFTNCDPPGAISAGAISINRTGQVAGSYDTGIYPFWPHAFIRDRAGNFTTISNPAASITWVLSTNNMGEIAGSYRVQASDDKFHAFIRSADGNFTNFDAPGAYTTVADAINDAGTVLGGYATAPDTAWHQFIRERGGNFIFLEVPGSAPDSTFIESINDVGQIAGLYRDNLGRHVFIRDANGTFTSFDTPGFVNSVSINNNGTVAGIYSVNSSMCDPNVCQNYHGFIRDAGGSFTTFDAPIHFDVLGQPQTVVGINDAGSVIGRYAYYDNYQYYHGLANNHGFIRDAAGTITSFDPPGSQSTSPHDINSAGAITGAYYDGSAYHCFIRESSDPTPPTITPNISGTLGPNGWYRSNVSIAWSVADPKSSIVSSSGCAPTTLTADTAGTKLTCSARNGAGLSNSASVSIKLDKTPPVISGMPGSGCIIAPANHKLTQVAVVTTADALSGLDPTSFKVVGASNEGDSSDTQIVIKPTGSGGFIVQLRADRSANGNGRIYTLGATAADLAGNATTATATCEVAQKGQK